MVKAYAWANPGWSWAPDWAPGCLTPCFGIKGAARCPAVVADAVSMITAKGARRGAAPP